MIKHFEKNTKGKDYVVGDIHGCFSLLESRLKEINFDEKVDRLFSVGESGTRKRDSGRWTERAWD